MAGWAAMFGGGGRNERDRGKRVCRFGVNDSGPNRRRPYINSLFQGRGNLMAG